MPLIPVVDKYAGKKLCDLTLEELNEFLGAVAHQGAIEALKTVGLDDADALTDMKSIRMIIKGYRAAKSTAWTTAAKVLATALTFWLISTLLPPKLAKTVAGYFVSAGQ